MNARAQTAMVITAVIVEGQSMDGVLAHYQSKTEKDKALLKALCFGVMRHYNRLKHTVDLLLAKPLKKKDANIYSLLLLGVYQLQDTRVPDHAAVSETVTAAKQLGKPWATGLINGVLRNFLKQREVLEASTEGEDHTRFSHPKWMVDSFKQDWPERWQTVLEQNNLQAPMVLRVNLHKVSRKDYIDQLAAAGIKANALSTSNAAIVLQSPCNIDSLPGFFSGHCSVQDGSAQLAAQLLNIQPGQRVLDACAAPGGKSGHLLEACLGGIDLTALDVSQKRLERVTDNLARLGYQAQVKVGDASQPASWWDGQQFSRILVDAPCSGLGVIRRHPDIKQLRRASDIKNLVGEQQLILERLWPLLEQGGLLLYSTCSVIKQENVGQVASFMSRHHDAREVLIDECWGEPCEYGRQVFPDEGMDGFYYVRIQKT